jgi:hypothetical protein
MARKWQLLLLASALLSPAGAGAAEKDGEKQPQEESPRERVWDDGRSQYGSGVVSATAGFTRVWEDVVFGVHGRGYAPESRREKEWRKEQKKRDKERREARREWEKESIVAAREERRGR